MSRVVVVLVGLSLGVPGASWAKSPQRLPLKLQGAKSTRLRMCGAVHRAASLSSSHRAGIRVPRAARSLVVARCAAGSWSTLRRVRVPRAKGHRGRLVRLPRLTPGGYRIGGRGLVPVYVRVVAARAKSLPLLDTSAVRAPMVAYCEGPDGKGPHRGDGAALPTDPRKLVNAHLKDTAAAAYFNASWMPVRDAPGMRPAPVQYPKTCGEFRRAAAAGRDFLYGRQMFQILGTTKGYENLWRVWGLNAKPADFDQQVRLRYGLTEAPFRNPYPKPGEDPMAANGGSGQLPLGLIQGIDEDTGNYNGKITIACAACHDSMLGTPKDGVGFSPGRGSDAFDASLLGAEVLRATALAGDGADPGALALSLAPYPYSAGRGITNSFGLVDLMGLGDMETLNNGAGIEVFPDHGAAGQVQTPNWWNRSHRARMFLQGELSGDNTRVSMALAVSASQRNGDQNKALEPKFEQVHVFFDSLSPPKYPGKIDEKLAEEGAILFHDKDLWSDPRNKAIPEPAGNGSCASCHGVYSPRYAHDKTFLPDPRLKGVEANITPIETIQTDPARTNLVNARFKRAWNTSWWGYDDLNPAWTKEGQGRAGTSFERFMYDYGVTDDRLEGPNKWSNEPNGYEAPPLYGAWASAPYFHNGSVPTIRDVLRPDRRPAIWRRPLTRPSQGGIVQGLDPSLDKYDFTNLGYKYSRLACDTQSPGAPLVPCRPHGTPLSTVEGELSKRLGPEFWAANQEPTPVSEDDRQRRMIFNSNEYSLGNQGHQFTQALTDREVDAILEYLKTL